MNCDVEYSEDISVSVDEMEGAIKKLDLSKSCGMDGIYAEHLKYCSRRIVPLLALCVTSLLVHGFLPDSMMSVVLVPIIRRDFFYCLVLGSADVQNSEQGKKNIFFSSCLGSADSKIQMLEKKKKKFLF